MDTLTAASTVATPSQNVPTTDHFTNTQPPITPMVQQQIPNNNNISVSGSISVPLTPASAAPTPLGLGLGLSSNKMSRALYAHKLRTHTNKLKQQTNKIMSNLKGKNNNRKKNRVPILGTDI